MLFLGGINWELVPDTSGKTVVNLIQGLNHADSRYPKLLRFLRNFAHRICVSPQVLDAIRPYAAGPLVLIRNGIPLERCRRRCTDAGSVVIVARKRAEFGEALRERMVRTGNRVEVLITWTPRETFLARLGTADIFVGLPYQAEGFYLPALEAMASGCAVV